MHTPCRLLSQPPPPGHVGGWMGGFPFCHVCRTLRRRPLFRFAVLGCPDAWQMEAAIVCLAFRTAFNAPKSSWHRFPAVPKCPEHMHWCEKSHCCVCDDDSEPMLGDRGRCGMHCFSPLQVLRFLLAICSLPRPMRQSDMDVWFFLAPFLVAFFFLWRL